jgi:branched-chain amino acid aminotransferase
MNVFFVFGDGLLVTPPLNGNILSGITRASLITLATELGWPVREEPYSLDQSRADAQSGRQTEAFACGTAAVLKAIGTIQTPKSSFTIGDGREGPRTTALRNTLLDIQRGRARDIHGWLDRLQQAPA